MPPNTIQSVAGTRESFSYAAPTGNSLATRISAVKRMKAATVYLLNENESNRNRIIPNDSR